MNGPVVGLVVRLFRVAVILGALSSCGEYEAAYFQEGVNQVTQEMVAKRYGAPHKVDKQTDGRVVWTYFERGSGTSSYSGTARGSYCRAYVLMFDDQSVLRDWREEDCSTKPATITDPFSDRN